MPRAMVSEQGRAQNVCASMHEIGTACRYKSITFGLCKSLSSDVLVACVGSGLEQMQAEVIVVIHICGGIRLDMLLEESYSLV